MMATSDVRVQEALTHGHLVDITTTGRRSGRPRRIELAFHPIGEKVYISGRPGWPRGWIANLHADPRMTFHLKGAFAADLPATGRVITDRTERERIIPTIAAGWSYDPAVMIASSPLIEVTFD